MSFTRSRAPRMAVRSATRPETESRMLRFLRRRAARAAGSVVSASPNSRSKTARGLFSTGSGAVGVRHESVLM